MANALQQGRFIVPGRGGARKSVISVDLAAEVLVRLALDPNPRYRLTNVGLPEAPTLRELCDAFSAECGFPRARSAPLALLSLGAVLGNLLAKVRPNFPLTTVNLAKLTTSTVVDVAKLYENFPDLPRPTFAEALRPAAAYYRGE
jgi:UDP-glucose 4-epimerase